MRAKRQRRERGFTLIELLVVVAIIGIIASIVIPNLIDALQKAKQRRTMADIKLVGTSWFSWYTDQVSAVSAGKSEMDWSIYDPVSYDDLVAEIVPQYSSKLVERDAWGFDLEFGIKDRLENERPMAIRSTGADGEFESGPYVPGPFIATSYDRDLVWSSGFFVRWPGAVNVEATP